MSTIAGTYEATFTVADIKKVFDRFAADYGMFAQSTGLHTRNDVDRNVAEIKPVATEGYLDHVDITLLDASGKEIRAAQYKVSESASSWSSQQPGNSLWPATPGGSLRIVVFFSKKWYALTDNQRENFRKNNGIAWTTSNADMSHSTLVKEFDRRYASNGYGMEKNLYKAV